MDVMGFVWLGIAILAAVVEAIVPSLVSVWFVPGGLAGLIVSLAGGPVWLQILIFLAVSLLCLAFTRPLTKMVMKHHRDRTNADRVVGATGIVIQDIDNVLAAGRVTVMGNSWSALSADGSKIDAGTRVHVEKIEGVKLIVTTQIPAKEEEGEG